MRTGCSRWTKLEASLQTAKHIKQAWQQLDNTLSTLHRILTMDYPVHSWTCKRTLEHGHCFQDSIFLLFYVTGWIDDSWRDCMLIAWIKKAWHNLSHFSPTHTAYGLSPFQASLGDTTQGQSSYKMALGSNGMWTGTCLEAFVMAWPSALSVKGQDELGRFKVFQTPKFHYMIFLSTVHRRARSDAVHKDCEM